MSVTAAAVSAPEERKILPHGWGDLFLQIGLWFGFLAAYQVARGVAGKGQFWKCDHLGPALRGLLRRADHGNHVPAEVSYCGVELRQGNAHSQFLHLAARS